MVTGDEEIRLFRDAVRARIEHAAADTGCGVREIPPSVLLSLLCASAFSALFGASAPGADAAGASGLGVLPPGSGILRALISGALDAVPASRPGPPSQPRELERELYWRLERVLAAGDEQAAALRAEIAVVLEESDAMRSALFAAIETGDDRLRGDVIAAIDTLSSGFAEMAFLLRTGDHGAAQMQRHLDGQDAQFRALGDAVRRQSADVRIARQDLAVIRQRQSLAARGHARHADAGPRWAAGCPYLGLLPFDQAHADVFCGRQRLTAELMVKLAGRLSGPAMVVVSGASGAGKSSLLHAGLLPTLAGGIQLDGSDSWPRVVMTPGGDPLTELAARLAAFGGGDAAAIRRGLAADPGRAHLAVGQALLADAARRAGHPGRLVIVVDQFEEVFTLNPGGDAGQQAFVDALCAAATGPSGPRGEPPALVVIAVRGDYWAHCAAHAGLARIMQDGMFVVGPMTGPELREAITGPAAAAGLQVDANLADIILSDLHAAGHEGAEGTLPLLSQVMLLTWGKREGSRLTVRGYNETGGVARSVESGAEAVYEALPDAGQHIAREIFQALVLAGPDGQLARLQVARAELCPDRRGDDRRAVDNVLEAFAGSRLLVLDGDTVQIAHDVLLRAWPRLRGWLDREQASWMLYTQLAEDAARWAGHGRDPSFVYRGSQLAAVQQAAARWAADPARYPALTGDQSGFLDASSRHASRGARVRRVAVLALAVLLLVSVAGVAVAARADRTANQQRDAAVSNQLAAQSEALDATNPVTAASLAAAAWKIDPTPEAQTALLDVLAQPERAAITAASGNVQGMAFSPDGRLFATTTDSGVAQVWDTATHREIGKPLKIGSLESVWFGRDQHAIALSGGSGSSPIRLWDLTTRHVLGSPFQITSNPIGWAVVSPDEKTMATDSMVNQDLVLLDVATHREISPVFPGVNPLAFSPDGKLLAVGLPAKGAGTGPIGLLDVATDRIDDISAPSSDPFNASIAFTPDGKDIAVAGPDSISFWDIARKRAIGRPLNVSAGELAYSPNGKLLATLTSNGSRSMAATVDLWDAASHQLLGGAVTVNAGEGLAFSPDSTMLATADGSTVSFWDVAVSRQTGALVAGGSSPLAFSPNGQILAAGTQYGVGLWNAATHQEIGRAIKVGSGSYAGAQAVAFSPDGKTLAIGARYNVGAQLWDVATLSESGPPIIRGNGDVGALAFSPDGRYLAIGGGSGSAWLWDTTERQVIGRPMINGGYYLSAVAFSPDGSILATADQGRIRLFSVATHHQVGVPLAVSGGSVNDVAFSPDGRMLATAGGAGVALWDAATHHQIGTSLNVGLGPVQTLAFSPDGLILAVGGQDGAIRLWDVASHEQIGSPLVVNNSNGIDALAFSPDGTLLAAANPVATRLWGMLPTANILGRVCAIAGGSMSRQQWSTYLKSEPYQLTCP